MIKLDKHIVLILLLALVVWGCGRGSREEIPLVAEIKDGVSVFDFARFSVDMKTSGNWAKPVRRNRTTFRIAGYPDGSVPFFVPRIEPYIIRFLLNKSGELRLRVNDRWYLKSKQKTVLVLRKGDLKKGNNILYISVKKNESIPVKKIEIYPRRHADFRRIKIKNRFLTPSRVSFYPIPANGRTIRIRFDMGWIKEAEVKVVIQSEKNRKEEIRVINQKPLYLTLLDNSWHKIYIDFPEIQSRFITLDECIQLKQASEPVRTVLPCIKRKGNVLLIVLDAARADHFGVYGYNRNTTPHIDQLARKSLVFTNCYSEAAYTLASTATLMTGLPPDCHDVLFRTRRLNKKFFTLARLFKDRGYHTAFVSANLFMGRTFNLDSGFDECLELFLGENPVLAGDFIAPFERLIANQENRPFFIYLHMREPHAPYSMPVPFLGTFQKEEPEKLPRLLKKMSLIYKNLYPEKPDQSDLKLLGDLYDENILYADSVVGMLLSALERHGIFDETIKIITSDHGEGLGEHGLTGHNVVLYGEGIHIPLIVNIPGYYPESQFITRPALTSDIAVTLCKLFDIEYPYPFKTQGKNLFRLPQKRLRISRSIPAFGNYSRYMVEYSGYKLIFRLPLDAEMPLLYNIIADAKEANPLEELVIPEEALFQFFKNFMSARKYSGARPIVKLRKEDRRSLRTLGYLD